MSEPLQATLNAAVLRLLRPLARLLLRHGMAYGSFAELARKAFVEEAHDLVAGEGRRPTISAVSALTGFSRKESKRLRELEVLEDTQSTQRYNRAIRVISGWTGDSRFQTGAGAPAVLPLEGESGSFADLVRAYSGDIPSAAMLAVLESSGTVSVDERGVTLQDRAYLPTATPAEKIDILGRDVAQLIATIEHNLRAESGQRLFQRKVSNVRVDPARLEAFKKLTHRKSQQLLEEYHEWLISHQVADSADEQTGEVAVGIYYWEHIPGEENPS